MTRVIQVRDVPDSVHAALQEAATARGMSLTRYLLQELERVSRRELTAAHNAEVVRGTRRAVGVTVSRDDVLAALQEGRRG